MRPAESGGATSIPGAANSSIIKSSSLDCPPRNRGPLLAMPCIANVYVVQEYELKEDPHEKDHRLGDGASDGPGARCVGANLDRQHLRYGDRRIRSGVGRCYRDIDECSARLPYDEHRDPR